jgi:hypothetical protein
LCLGIVAVLSGFQPPAPGGAAVATTTITILANGQLVGATAILNLFAGTGPSGIVGTCTPNPALGSIDCNIATNSVVNPTWNQLYQNPLYCHSTNGTPGYTCPLNAFTGPPTAGMIVDLVTDTACATTCTLSLTGGSGAGITITQSDGMTAPNGAIVAGQMKPLWFDGTVLRII